MEEYYICSNVGISQNHLVVIAREKKTGKRIVLTCGNNEYKALCKVSEEKQKYDIPTKIEFFDEKSPDEEPIMTSLSRFQTYLMSIKVDLKENINKTWSEFKCAKCAKELQYVLYFEFTKYSNINYYCDNCALANDKNIFFVLNIINPDTKNNLENIFKEKIPINDLCAIPFETNQKQYTCTNCNEAIKDFVFQNYSNSDLILCGKCFNSKCSLIEYPQLFISFNK